VVHYQHEKSPYIWLNASTFFLFLNLKLICEVPIILVNATFSLEKYFVTKTHPILVKP